MDRILAYFSAVVSRQAQVALALSVAVFCGFAALCFAVASLWIFAVPVVGAGGAPLVAAIPLLLAGLAGCLIARRLGRRQLPPAAPDLTVIAVSAATQLTRFRPATALAAAVIAGMLTGITRQK